MVTLKPNKQAQKAYPKINWDTLSLVYSAILDTVYKSKKRRNYIIRVKLCKGEWNWYSYDSIGGYINITKMKKIKNFHRVLLHEFRHWIQNKILHIRVTADYEKLYRKHPIEIDAMNFENKGLPYTIRLYNRIERQKKLFAKINEYRPKNTKTNRNGNTSRSKLRAQGKGSK